MKKHLEYADTCQCRNGAESEQMGIMDPVKLKPADMEKE